MITKVLGLKDLKMKLLKTWDSWKFKSLENLQVHYIKLLIYKLCNHGYKALAE